MVYYLPFQARRLEAQLDDQMIAYRKLVSMKSDGSENDIESDIERSLKQLQQVNSQMQTWVSSGGSEVLSHTLTRHMEILQDLTQVLVASYKLLSSIHHNYFECTDKKAPHMTSLYSHFDTMICFIQYRNSIGFDQVSGRNNNMLLSLT